MGKRKGLTVPHLVKMWWMQEEGKSRHQIAKEIGINSTAVSNYLYGMRGANLDPPSSHATKKMKRAMELIREGEHYLDSLSKAKEEKISSEDVFPSFSEANKIRYFNLEEAMKNLQSTVIDFIEAEVSRRINEERAEFKALRKEYEEFKTRAKHSNWIWNLRKKLGS